MSRNHVDVKMRDALTDSVVDPDKRSVRSERGLQGRRGELDHTKQRCDEISGQLDQCRNMASGHDQDMAFKDRARVEKGDHVVVGVDNQSVGLPGGDRTEQARLGHRCSLLRLRPVSAIRSMRFLAYQRRGLRRGPVGGLDAGESRRPRHLSRTNCDKAHSARYEWVMTSGEIVTALIHAIESKNLEAAVALLADDIEYDNVPMAKIHGRNAVGDALGAFVGDAKRIEWVIHRQIEHGNIVMNERNDIFEFDAFTVDLPVAGIFTVADEKITLWRDYFDLDTLKTQTTRTA